MITLYIAGLYLLIGIIFSIPFLTRWVKAIDEGVHNAPWTFYLIILPGCIVFWPSLLKRYLAARKR